MDVSVVALAEALSAPTQTLLTQLNIHIVRMGDEGIIALASLIHQGRFEQLKHIDISGSFGITQRGFIALIQEIDACGLPKLEAFGPMGNETSVWICPLAHSLIKRCPERKEIRIRTPTIGNIDEMRVAIRGILEAAGRVGEVTVRPEYGYGYDDE